MKNDPTSTAVMSLRPENATHTIGMAAAGRPMLDGAMNCPHDVYITPLNAASADPITNVTS